MLIKRKDLEQRVKALEAETRMADIITARVLGQQLLKVPDPVDVVPVQDYPFPINIPDVVKSCNEGPSR